MKMNEELVQEPMHYRISGRDYILILLKNGDLYLKNRRGENYDGFPVKLGSEIGNRVYVDLKRTIKNSFIRIITDLGTLYNISFDGKIISKIEKLRPDKSSKFKMIMDALDKNPIIISLENNKIYKDEYYINFKNSSNLTFQYYNFGNDKKFIIFNDPSSKKSYFYSPNLETYMPSLPSSNNVSIIYSKSSFKFYTIFNNTLSMIDIKK